MKTKSKKQSKEKVMFVKYDLFPGFVCHKAGKKHKDGSVDWADHPGYGPFRKEAILAVVDGSHKEINEFLIQAKALYHTRCKMVYDELRACLIECFKIDPRERAKLHAKKD